MIINRLHRLRSAPSKIWDLVSFSSLQNRRSLKSNFRNTKICQFSQFTRGQDLLGDSLTFGSQRKIILDGYSPSGVDILGMVEYSMEKMVAGDSDEEEQSQEVHMNGSIIAFPHSCFLWKVSKPKDVTLESLSMVLLCKPSVDILFIGSDETLPPRELNRIHMEFKKKAVVTEQMDLTNAMGTFNILNGEDRRIAVALLINGWDE